MRALLLVTLASASLAVPTLSSSASATCWIDCRPGLPLPIEPLPEPSSGSDELEIPYSESTSCEFASVEPGGGAIPVPDPYACPPSHRWVCCSPPGGPVCCTPPGGGPSICYGGGGFEEVSTGSEIDACSFEVDATDGEPVLECRADEVEPWLAVVLTELVAMWA